MKNLLITSFLLSLIICCNTKNNDNTVNVSSKDISIPKEVNKLILALKKDTNNVELKLKIYKSLDSLGIHIIALQYIDELIKNDSLNNDYWLKRGQLCKQLEDTTAALKAFRYAARIYPTPMALMELANLYAETKNPLAIKVSNQLMQMNPDGNYNAQSYFFIGVYYSKISDNKNALIAFNKSNESDFSFTETYIEKGVLLYNEKKYQDALKVFKQLTSISQTNADGYYWQAKCFEKQNNKVVAIELYKKSLMLNSKLVEADVALNRLKN